LNARGQEGVPAFGGHTMRREQPFDALASIGIGHTPKEPCNLRETESCVSTRRPGLNAVESEICGRAAEEPELSAERRIEC